MQALGDRADRLVGGENALAVSNNRPRHFGKVSRRHVHLSHRSAPATCLSAVEVRSRSRRRPPAAICELIGSARPLRGYIRDVDGTHTTPIQLVLADVDGTLVTPDKKITERTKQAVRKLADANIGFAITSGRPPRGMAMLIEPLGLRTPIAGFNGGMIVGTDMTPIDALTISPEYVGPIIRGLIARGLDAWVYQNGDWLVRDEAAPYVDREQSNVQFAPIVTPDLDRHVEGVVKIVGVSSDYALVAACENEARERFGDLVSAARSAPRYLDITHPDANKGHVVRRISRNSAFRPRRSRPWATWPTMF